MNESIGRPEIGQWYLHRDKGEMFCVIGCDQDGSVEIQNFDGDVDEIEAAAWSTLPLQRASEPEDWTGPVDDVEIDDLGYSETAMRSADWSEPLQSFQPVQEAWEDEAPEDERDPEAEEMKTEELFLDRAQPPA